MKIPREIFLQWVDEFGEEPNEIYEGVTWCVDRINDSDVRYAIAPPEPIVDAEVVSLKAENTELKCRLQAMEVFLAAIHMTDPNNPNTPDDIDDITDGFGGTWPRYCKNCGAQNEIIRPGDCRCSRRCYESRQNDAYKTQ